MNLKKHNCTIDMHFDKRRGVTIEVKDEASRIYLLNIEVKAEDVCGLMSNIMDVKGTAQINNDGVKLMGKKLEVDTLTFMLPKEVGYTSDAASIAKELVKNHIPIGWTTNDRFDSKDSITMTDNGCYKAKCNIRRYV